MKKFNSILLAILFVSTVAIGQNLNSEKEIDNSEYVIAEKADSQSGSLDNTDPTYDRIFGGGTSMTCDLATSFSGSGSGVYYDVYEIHSTVGENVVVTITSDGLGDSVITLYCDFDPNNADANVVCYDDDGGVGLMSAFTPADNILIDANTSYYLVVSSFSPTTGGYTVDLGGDLQFGPPPAPVPLSNWAFIIIGLLAVTFVFIKFRK